MESILKQKIMTANEIIDEIAEKTEGKLYEDYSGRAMFGKTCRGIVTDSPVYVVELAKQYGLTGHRSDNMGKKAIIYWPNPKIEEVVDDADDYDDDET